MFGTILTAAAPTLVRWGLNALGNVFGGGKKAQQQQQQQVAMSAPDFSTMPAMNYADALSQAQSMVNPIYDQQLDQTLKNIDYQNMQRGFYGQLPGDALKGSRALDVERARAGQTTNLAQQLMQQSQAHNLAQQQLQMQQWLAGNQLGMQQQQAGRDAWMQPAQFGLNALGTYYHQTGSPLWEDLFKSWKNVFNKGNSSTFDPNWNQFLNYAGNLKDEYGRNIPVPY